MKTIPEELFAPFSDDEIRDQLFSDFDDLHLCMEAGSLKGSVVLIGSMIEALLYYYIDHDLAIKKKIPNYEKRNVSLNDLLVWGKKYGLIDHNLFRLAEPIRDYRNLIHARVQKRSGIQLSENIVQIAYNVLHEILLCLNRVHRTISINRHEEIIANLIREELAREPRTDDFHIYMPVMAKYGVNRASLIIRNSLSNLQIQEG